jgi:hypothetical protein
MSKIVEYRVVPVERWIITRFESASEGTYASVGSTQRGMFQNEDEANEVAGLLAKAEDGARFISRDSRIRPVSSPIGSGGLSSE